MYKQNERELLLTTTTTYLLICERTANKSSNTNTRLDNKRKCSCYENNNKWKIEFSEEKISNYV